VRGYRRDRSKDAHFPLCQQIDLKIQRRHRRVESAELLRGGVAQGMAFTLNGEEEATLKLVVPEPSAKVLSDKIHRLRSCSFVVRIDGVR